MIDLSSQENYDLKTEEYQKLCEKINKCHKCKGMNKRSLEFKTSTLSVCGHGNLNSMIIFVGQSPCVKCQETQIPFYPYDGRKKLSGYFLDLALELAGYKREEFFITNIVCCHAPDNRANTEEEMRNCEEYLLKIIEIINPLVIIPLGNQACSFFFQKPMKITKIKKDIYDTKYGKIYPLEHPSWIMKNYNLDCTILNKFVKDIKWITELVKDISIINEDRKE